MTLSLRSLSFLAQDAALTRVFCAGVEIKQDNVCKVLGRGLALSQRLINGKCFVVVGEKVVLNRGP